MKKTTDRNILNSTGFLVIPVAVGIQLILSACGSAPKRTEAQASTTLVEYPPQPVPVPQTAPTRRETAAPTPRPTPKPPTPNLPYKPILEDIFL